MCQPTLLFLIPEMRKKKKKKKKKRVGKIDTRGVGQNMPCACADPHVLMRLAPKVLLLIPRRTLQDNQCPNHCKCFPDLYAFHYRPRPSIRPTLPVTAAAPR